MELPIVDLLADDETASKILHEACLQHGFFYLDGHGITSDEFQEILRVTRHFFRLPLESKMAISRNACGRGYDPPTVWAREDWATVPESDRKRKESFMIGREVNDDEMEQWGQVPHSFVGPNLWPPDSPELRDVAECYFQRCWDVARKLLRIVALSAGYPSNHFEYFCQHPTVALRFLRYLPEVSRPEDEVFAAAPHTDYGIFTLLLTDGTPGLEMEWNGEWLPVEPIPGLLICNVGDALSSATGGDYKATRHRVCVDKIQERYSVPFFFEPSLKTPLESIRIASHDASDDQIALTASSDNTATYATHLIRKVQESLARG